MNQPEDENAVLIVDILGRLEKLEAEVFGGKKKKGVKTDGAVVFEAYREAFLAVYGTEPLRNAQSNAQAKTIAARVGQAEGADLMRYYLAQRDAFYVRSLHPLGICLKDIDTLVTRMRTKMKITHKQAVQIEQQDSNQRVMNQIRGEDDLA